MAINQECLRKALEAAGVAPAQIEAAMEAAQGIDGRVKAARQEWEKKYPQVVTESIRFDPTKGRAGELVAKCRCPQCGALSNERGPGDFQWYGQAHVSRYGCQACKGKGKGVSAALLADPRVRAALAAAMAEQK